MQNTYSPIKEIKDLGEGIWRVDWFGKIKSKPLGSAEFMFQVVLSRIKDNWKETDFAIDDATDANTRCSVYIGVGQLPLIYIGSLWREGTRLETSAGEVETFADLDIGTLTTQISKANEQVEGQTLVPFSFHQVSKEGLNSLCIHVNHNGDSAGIIIPTIEIIRFYFATSTPLSKALFEGSFTHNINSLINPEFTGMTGNRCVVNRRKEFSDIDCWTIGRIINSDEAYKAVRLINDSLIKAKNNNSEAFPETGFPFAGKTTIRARCKRIGWKKKRWLVLSLLTCTGPFPYEELEVIADNDARSADPDTDIPDNEKLIAYSNRKLIKGTVTNSDLPLQSIHEPEANTEEFKITILENRFSAIQGKEIIKSPKEKCLYKAGSLKPIVRLGLDNMLGTGDAVHNSGGVIPASLQVNAKQKGLPSSFDVLVEILKILNKYPSVTAKLHPFPWGNGLIGARLTNRAGKRQWSYISTNPRRVRQFMIADISYKGKNFTLIEIERRPDSASDTYLAEIIYKSDGAMISSGELDAIVNQLSRVDGRMKNIPVLAHKIQRFSPGLKHTWKNTSQYANAIISLLELERTR